MFHLFNGVPVRLLVLHIKLYFDGPYLKKGQARGQRTNVRYVVLIDCFICVAL